MSKPYTLLLEPIDVLSFRDYRGLESGEQHDVGTVFPTPTVMFGAVRGALFRAAGADFNEIAKNKYQSHYGVDERYRDWLGGPSSEEPFQIGVRGPWLARDLHGAPTLWLPMPLDRLKRGVFIPKDHGSLTPSFHGSTHRAATLLLKPPGDKGEGRCDTPADRTRPCPGHADEDSARYVLASDLRRECPERAFFDTERRVGIARDLNKRTVVPGLFYLQDTLRFAEGVGLAVEVDTITGKHEELLKRLHGQAIPLGGRGHHVRVQVVEGSMKPAAPTTGDRLWCLTPMPILGDDGLVLPTDATLDALYTRAPLVVGGFDRANNKPHKLTRVLPAGTVLKLGGALGGLTQHNWGMNPTQIHAGFGVTQLLGDSP
jgi:CRISPR type III-B/RAMP module-associated protein Cmr3